MCKGKSLKEFMKGFWLVNTKVIEDYVIKAN